jgi:CHAT domain-containing protein
MIKGMIIALSFWATTVLADITTLVPLQQLERKLKNEESHHYQINVPAGNFVEVKIEQIGIDAFVSLTGPDGKKIVDMDSMLGPDGPERVFIVSEVRGDYTIEVRGAAIENPSATYKLIVGKIRKSEPLDKKRLIANEKLAEGVRLYTQGGDAASLNKAEVLYSESLEIWRELKDPIGQALALHGLALIFDYTGNREKGLSLYQETLPIWEKFKYHRVQTLVLNNIGYDYYRLGEIQKAYQWAEKSLSASRKSKDPHNEAHAHANLGEFYLDMGEYQKAIDHHSEALKLRRVNKIHSEEADSLYELGTLHNLIGDSQTALNYFLQVIPLDIESGNKRDQAATLQAIGTIYHDRGDFSTALDYYQKSLLLKRASKDKQGEASSLLNIGQIYSAQAKNELALQFYLDSLKIAKDTKELEYEIDAAISLAQLNIDTKKISQANDWSLQAIELSKKAERPEDQWQANFVRARALRLQNQNEQALENLTTAIKILNSLRAHVPTDSTKIGFLDKRQEVFHELADLQLLSGQFANSLETSEAARSRALVDLLAAQQNRLNALKKDKNELISTEPLSFLQIQNIVKRLQATVVEYLVTKKQLFIWVIHPSGEIQSQIVAIDRDRLKVMIRDLHDRLDNADVNDLRNPQRINPPLRELHKYLIEPVAAYLPRNSETVVYVVPHDVLFLVPFSALLDSNSKPLIEKHTIASAPSISVLAYTEKKKHLAISVDKPTLLAVADPVLPKNTGMEALPGARVEAQGIGQFFSSDRVSLLEGAKATEANIKRLSGEQTILHFAVHGEIFNDKPWESALLLTDGDGEDGHLKASEIFGLDLHSDLIVLSGCSTGLGKLSGDGIIGLSRAFIYAGTPSLIVSQWDVSDKATTFLMKKFYGAMRDGLNKAAALRVAKLESFREFRHPTLWAAFDLIGEAQ